MFNVETCCKKKYYLGPNLYAEIVDALVTVRLDFKGLLNTYLKLVIMTNGEKRLVLTCYITNNIYMNTCYGNSKLCI